MTHETYGIQLVGSREGLRLLSSAIADSTGGILALGSPSRLEDGDTPIRAIHIRDHADGNDPVRFYLDGSSLIIEGGLKKREIFGGGIDNLSKAPYRVTPSSVPTHMDVDYYPGHYYLDPANTSSMTLYVEPDEDE